MRTLWCYDGVCVFVCIVYVYVCVGCACPSISIIHAFISININVITYFVGKLQPKSKLDYHNTATLWRYAIYIILNICIQTVTGLIILIIFRCQFYQLYFGMHLIKFFHCCHHIFMPVKVVTFGANRYILCIRNERNAVKLQLLIKLVMMI